jgi:hypothetical protein
MSFEALEPNPLNPLSKSVDSFSSEKDLPVSECFV